VQAQRQEADQRGHVARDEASTAGHHDGPFKESR
jgi:hypothetical protein